VPLAWAMQAGCVVCLFFGTYVLLTDATAYTQQTCYKHILKICSLVSECTWLDARERVRESSQWVCRLCVHVSMSMHALIHMRVSTRIASVHGQVQHRAALLFLPFILQARTSQACDLRPMNISPDSWTCCRDDTHPQLKSRPEQGNRKRRRNGEKEDNKRQMATHIPVAFYTAPFARPIGKPHFFPTPPFPCALRFPQGKDPCSRGGWQSVLQCVLLGVLTV